MLNCAVYAENVGY